MAQKKHTGVGANPPNPTDNGSHQEQTRHRAMSSQDAKKALEQIQDRVTSFVREKPLAAMGIAMAAGYLVAKIITRR